MIDVILFLGNYFSEAYNDTISVWEDESISFDVLANDYIPGGQFTITELSTVSDAECLVASYKIPCIFHSCIASLSLFLVHMFIGSHA